jgi:arylsulfatase A-like enzyme
MTGYYNHRIGTQANVIYWDTPWAPSLNFTFLPQRLKDAQQYDTAMFGKWHLGMFREQYYPSFRGFDTFVGYLQVRYVSASLRLCGWRVLPVFLRVAFGTARRS